MPTAIRSDKIDLSLEKNTEKFAIKFSKKLKPGHIVFLYGIFASVKSIKKGPPGGGPVGRRWAGV